MASIFVSSYFSTLTIASLLIHFIIIGKVRPAARQQRTRQKCHTRNFDSISLLIGWVPPKREIFKVKLTCALSKKWSTYFSVCNARVVRLFIYYYWWMKLTAGKNWWRTCFLVVSALLLLCSYSSASLHTTRCVGWGVVVGKERKKQPNNNNAN